ADALARDQRRRTRPDGPVSMRLRVCDRSTRSQRWPHRDSSIAPAHLAIPGYYAAQRVDVRSVEVRAMFLQRLPGIPGRTQQTASDAVARGRGQEHRKRSAFLERRAASVCELLHPLEERVTHGAWTRGKQFVHHARLESARGDAVDVDPRVL